MAEDLYGLMAEFVDPDRLVDGVRRIRLKGYRDLDAYTPFSVRGLAEAMDCEDTRPGWIALIAGLLCGLGVFFMEEYSAVVAYPLDVGGRPLDSWPMFIVPAFEGCLLGASVAAFGSIWILSGLPQPYHPVSNVPSFQLASRDRFFLIVKRHDPLFDRDRTWTDLCDLAPQNVFEVEP